MGKKDQESWRPLGQRRQRRWWMPPPLLSWIVEASLRRQMSHRWSRFFLSDKHLVSARRASSGGPIPRPSDQGRRTSSSDCYCRAVGLHDVNSCRTDQETTTPYWRDIRIHVDEVKLQNEEARGPCGSIMEVRRMVLLRCGQSNIRAVESSVRHGDGEGSVGVGLYSTLVA